MAHCRFGIDLGRDELTKDEGTLRMPDEHDAPAIVVLVKVVNPGTQDVVVGKLRLRRRRLARDVREGQLPVHRREHPAVA